MENTNAAGLVLALTTVGDLLLRNRISRDDDGRPIENILLKVPEYQRPYKWTVKNALQLFDDIRQAKAANKEVYRVGTLILHHADADAAYNIVDGQQRVITFALLLRALGEENIDFLNQELNANDFNRRNVPDNFRALRRRIEALGQTRELEDFRAFVETQCEMIVVITSDISEAFQFFDSQNARGKKLYPHDLLKAYHLREMSDVAPAETERIVKMWEDLDQRRLAALFGDYLYRVREWVRGNRAWELNEHNIDKFKGITKRDNSPYAQFYKGAFAYADTLNRSALPFVSGMHDVAPFQLNAPIVAGRPFFEYAKHYFDILADIRNNDKYEGYFINDNVIVKTLDLRHNRNGVGNGIVRLMFDVAALLYVDRFCSTQPSRTDIDLFEQFVVCDFIWAYSLRAQYQNLGWASAQNYIMGASDRVNAFNLYKVVGEADAPASLLSELAELLKPLPRKCLRRSVENIDAKNEEGIFENYLHFFQENHFLIG